MALPETIGQYRVVELLGRGGMGEVYKAVDTRMFGRVVAIKVASAQLTPDEQASQRFQREARTAATLQHPGIAIIHDRGEFEGRQYFVMEYLDGKDLSAAIRERSLDFEERLDVSAQIAGALAYAHAQGVVHRDVKPGNIMVVTKGGAPQAKLLDFGIAHVARSDASMTIAQPGTTPYMSPEQLRDEPVDARSDLFCLGIVLYELFTGVHPFSTKSAYLVSQKILVEDPLAPRTVDPAIPPTLDTLILRLLKKSPAERPENATVVVQELRRVLKDYRSLRTSHPGQEPESLDDMTRALLDRILRLSRKKEEHGDLAEALQGYRRAAQLDPGSGALQEKIENLEATIGSAAPAPSGSLTTTQLLSDPSGSNRADYVQGALASAQQSLEAGAFDRASAVLADVLRHYPEEAKAAEMLERLMIIINQNIPYGSYRAAIGQARTALGALDLEGARKAHAIASNLWPGDAEAVALGKEIEARERLAQEERDEARGEMEALHAQARGEAAAAAKEESRGVAGLEAAVAAAERADALLEKALAFDSSQSELVQDREEIRRFLETLKGRLAKRQKQRAEARASAEEARALLREAARLAEGDAGKLSRAVEILEEIRRRLETLATIAPEETSPKEILAAAAALRESAAARLTALEDRQRDDRVQRLLLEADGRIRASRERSHSTETGVSESLEEARASVALAKEALEVQPDHARGTEVLRQGESLVREMAARLESLQSARVEEQRFARDRTEKVDRRSKADALTGRARQLRSDAESLGAEDATERKTALLDEAATQLRAARELIPDDGAITRELREAEELHRSTAARLKEEEVRRRRTALGALVGKAQSLLEQGHARQALTVLEETAKQVPKGDLGAERQKIDKLLAEARLRIANSRAAWTKRIAGAAAVVAVVAIGALAVRSVVRSRTERRFAEKQAVVAGLVGAAEATAEQARSKALQALDEIKAGQDQIGKAREGFRELSDMDPQAASLSGLSSRIDNAERETTGRAHELTLRLGSLLDQAAREVDLVRDLASQPKPDRDALLGRIAAVEEGLKLALAIDKDNSVALGLRARTDGLRDSLPSAAEEGTTTATTQTDQAQKKLDDADWNINEARKRLHGSKKDLQDGLDYCDRADRGISAVPRTPAYRSRLAKREKDIRTLRQQLNDGLATIVAAEKTPAPLPKPVEPAPPPPPPQPTTDMILAEAQDLLQRVNQADPRTLKGAREQISLATEALGKLKRIPGSPDVRKTSDDLEDRRMIAQAWLTMFTYAERFNRQDVEGVLAICRTQSREDLEDDFKDRKIPPEFKVENVEVTKTDPDRRWMKVKVDMKDRSVSKTKKILRSIAFWKAHTARLTLDGDHYVIEKM